MLLGELVWTGRVECSISCIYLFAVLLARRCDDDDDDDDYLASDYILTTYGVQGKLRAPASCATACRPKGFSTSPLSKSQSTNVGTPGTRKCRISAAARLRSANGMASHFIP